MSSKVVLPQKWIVYIMKYFFCENIFVSLNYFFISHLKVLHWKMSRLLKCI